MTGGSQRRLVVGRRLLVPPGGAGDVDLGPAQGRTDLIDGDLNPALLNPAL